MRLLRAKGWVCSRSAMSHGPVDVFAAKAGKVILIQVKSGSARMSQRDIKLLKSYALAFNADAEVWSFKKRGKIQKVKLSKRIMENAPLPSMENLARRPAVIAIPTVEHANPSF
jgi:Holliday junction resolvase